MANTFTPPDTTAEDAATKWYQERAVQLQMEGQAWQAKVAAMDTSNKTQTAGEKFRKYSFDTANSLIG